MISVLQPLRSLALILIGALLLSSVAPVEAARLQVVTTLAWHTATQLLDGRVLVAGGDGANTRFYRPGVSDAYAGPPLSTSRHRHTATLLLNGEVLVVGGLDADEAALASSERFDPYADRWRTGAALAIARAGHTATLLPDGAVLVVGGEDDAGVATATVERYDPMQERWTLLAPMALPRTGHTATLLPDGRVAVIGGRNQNSVLSSIELYDPSNDAWTTAAFDLQTPRYDHTATLRHDGRIVIIGGSNRFDQPLASVEVLDPASGVAAGPLLNTARAGCTASLRPDGALIVAGGLGQSALDSVEALLPDAAAWTTLDPLTTPRHRHTATVAPGGAVLFVGGQASGADAEWLIAPLGGWQTRAGLGAFRHSHTATLLRDGTVLVAGGLAGVDLLVSSERYDPATDSWQAAGAINDARYGHTATLLGDGSVLITGGAQRGATLQTVERYDPASDAWRLVAPMQSPRRHHTATLLADGDVLVIGGSEVIAQHLALPASGASSQSAERYDPATDVWSRVAAPGAPRVDHTATLLANGRVLVVGGNGEGLTAANAAEVYDPDANQWQTTGPMSNLRAHHTATLLPDGRVLVAGGLDPLDESFTILTSVEVFDPATNTWQAGAALPTPRQYQTATLLPHGEVLLIGGEDRSGLLTSAGLYDPVTDRWRTLPGRALGRLNHTATLLLDGRVLAVGGLGQAVSLGDVFAYAPAASVEAPALMLAGLDDQGQVVLRGSGFRPASSASGAATQQSATNAPLVQLRRLESERLVYPGQAAGALFSGTAITTTTIISAPALRTGPVMVTVFVNGAASPARFLVDSAPAEENRLYLPMMTREMP